MMAMFVPVVFLLCVLQAQAMDLHRVMVMSKTAHFVPKVHCWCASYPNRTLCSWPDSLHALPTHYIATYSERLRQSVNKPCHIIPPGQSSELTPGLPPSAQQLWHCHLPDLKLLTDYILNVTAVYPNGSSSHLSSFMVEDIVKPDPPMHVRVSPQNAKMLLVEWDPPSTWENMDIFPLKYQIQYQWWIKGSMKSVNLGPFESTKIPLKGLASGRTYQFQVCAKEILGLGHCSDWSSPFNVTISRTRP